MTPEDRRDLKHVVIESLEEFFGKRGYARPQQDPLDARGEVHGNDIVRTGKTAHEDFPIP